MTNYIILVLCLIIFLAYIFDLTSKYTRIPGIILLIVLGILLQFITGTTGLKIPNLKPFLPVLGTIGLILIVLEASLDLKLEKKKAKLILKSVVSAVSLFVFFVAGMSFIMIKFMNINIRDSLLNSLPFGVISSAVAISAALNLPADKREFVVYESSISDIIGILTFDFILLNQGSVIKGFFKSFVLGGVLIFIIALAVTVALAYLLYKSKYHVNYIIILTAVVCMYALAKLLHLPALLFILIFGLVMANNRFVENSPLSNYVDFEKFRSDLASFKKIVGELTFLVRSFFFIVFGFYVRIDGLLNIGNIITGLALTSFIFLLRWIFLEKVIRIPSMPLLFFAPRGLITILLFMSIPESSIVPFVNEEVVTLVILMTITVLAIGNISYKPFTGETQTISGDFTVEPQTPGQILKDYEDNSEIDSLRDTGEISEAENTDEEKIQQNQ